VPVPRRLLNVGVMLVVALGLMASVVAGQTSSSVALKEGRVGRAFWHAWLEPSQKRQDPTRACRNVALVVPTKGGLWAQSELRECGSVSPSEPVIESIDSGRGRQRRGVWLGLFSSEVDRIYIAVGNRQGKVVTVAHLTPKDAAKLHTEQMGFWAHGFAGITCLRRLITYDSSGARLSDSGRGPCG
jgi:hypothetical protein